MQLQEVEIINYNRKLTTKKSYTLFNPNYLSYIKEKMLSKI
jgi:hypothetical protein